MISKLKVLAAEEIPEYTCISHSQAKSYLTCRRKWQLERVYSRKYKDYFTIGKLVHAGVALYYNNIKDGTQHSIVDELAAVATQMLEESPGQEESIKQCLADATIYVMNYANFAKEHDNFKPLEIEKDYVVELDAELKTACRIIIDGLVEDENGDLYILEHKTPARIEESHLPMDTQVTLYAALVEGMLGRPVVGIIYNMIRKKTPSAPKILQNGGLSSAAIDTTAEIYKQSILDIYGSVEAAPEPVQARYNQLVISKNEYIARRILRRTDEEKMEVLARFKHLAEEISFVKRTSVGIVPNPGRDCGTMCDFAELCTMKNKMQELPTPEDYAKELLMRGDL